MRGAVTASSNGHSASPPSLALAWTVWGLGAFFYLIGFYQRVAPAVMTSELMRAFNLDGTGLGHLSGLYFYSYVAMQIPTGMLADAWGPRRLLAGGALTAAAGAMIFALAPSFFWAGLGRLMIGGSVAVAFVALLKLSNHWFPSRLFALVSGMALFFGVVGAVTAGVPLRLLVNWLGWRPVILASGLVTLGVGLAIWFWVRDDPSQRGHASHAPAAQTHGPRTGALAGLGRVFTIGNVWLLSLAPGGMVGAILSFSGLWGVPYLRARYGLAPTEGAALCSLLMICWAVAGPVLGGLSDRIGRRKPFYLGGALIGAGCWTVMILAPSLPLTWFIALLVLAGLASGAMIIGFAWAKESVPPPQAGTVAGVVNMGVMIGPTLLQPLIGWMLDQHWTGLGEAGARLYTPQAYQAGFTPLLIWLGLACLFLAFARETRCRQMG